MPHITNVAQAFQEARYILKVAIYYTCCMSPTLISQSVIGSSIYKSLRSPNKHVKSNHTLSFLGAVCAKVWGVVSPSTLIMPNNEFYTI